LRFLSFNQQRFSTPTAHVNRFVMALVLGLPALLRAETPFRSQNIETAVFHVSVSSHQYVR